MYRKLMMLLAVVAVLGLAIGLVGCPQPEPEGAPPPRQIGPPPLPPVEVEEGTEEAPAEEAPAEEAPAEEAPAEATGE